MTTQSALLIERREYKYLVDEVTAARVRELIRPFCELDPYAARERGHRYSIDSLYFDTAGFSLFRANQVEQMDRYKLRVRTYPMAPSGPVFFEVKRRINDVIAKTRGRVPRDQWVELLSAPGAQASAALAGLDPRDRVGVERFLALVLGTHAAPVVVVRYEREPWMSRVDDYARVTFDRHIRSQRMNALSFDTDSRSWRAVDDPSMERAEAASMTILELKFTSAVPSWMVGVVRQLDLWRRAFSKYGTSVMAWYGPMGLERQPTPRGFGR